MLRLVILCLAFFLGAQIFAADCGRFAVVKQPVKVKKQGQKKFKKAIKNKQICQGDTVKTKDNGRARIVMDDTNQINVSPNTEIIIESYKSRKQAVLNIINGKVRSYVKNKYQDSNTSHFRVKTKSAVAGVRGTEFLTSYNAQTNQARVVTFEGEVAVGKMSGGTFVAKVTVKQGQFTASSKGQDPQPAKPVPPTELAQLDRESQVTDPAGKAPASQGRQPAKQEQEQDSDESQPQAEKPQAKEAASEEPSGQGTSQKAPKKQQAPTKASDSTNKSANDKPRSTGSMRAGGLGKSAPRRGLASVSKSGNNNPSGPMGNAARGNLETPQGDKTMRLPPPKLTDLPGTDGAAGLIEPPSAPLVNNPILPVIPECLTCNDAVINKKVKVIITPVIGGRD